MEGIRQRCRDSNDTSWYDRQYALQIAIAGYMQYLNTGAGALLRTPSRNVGLGKADIADYPILDPGESIRGVANHMLINARISIESIVLALPDIHLKLSDETEREIGEKWFEDCWINGDWSEDVFMTGMNVEANAIGWMVSGPTKAPSSEQTIKWMHVDTLDMLFDRGYKSPGQWRWICYRERVPLDDAVERFGHIFNQDLAAGGSAERFALEKNYGIMDLLAAQMPDHELTDEEIVDLMKTTFATRRSDPLTAGWMDRATMPGGTIRGETNVNDYVVHVWHYWDADHHMCFLSSIDGRNSLPLAYRQMAGPDSGWNYQIATEAGPNPYGMVPAAWWIDSWAPGMWRPTAKSETVQPLSDMLRYIELLITKTIKQGLPVIITQQMSPEMREQWNRAMETADPMAFIENDIGISAKDFMERIPAAELPEIWLQARSLLKSELDAATGVTAPFRGEGFGGGEKTRKEATDLATMSATQQRHLRGQYAKFLEMLVRVSRKVGSIVDVRARMLELDDGPIQVNGKGYPLAMFLDKPCHVYIDPNDMVWRPKEEVEAEALAFLHECEKGIDMGQLNPRLVWKDFLGKFGRKKLKLMFTDQEMQQNQQSKMQAAQKQAAQLGIEKITVTFDKLPDSIKQAWAEWVGFVKPGQKIDWGPNAEAAFEAHLKVQEHAAKIAHEGGMQDRDHTHEAGLAAMPPPAAPTEQQPQAAGV